MNYRSLLLLIVVSFSQQLYANHILDSLRVEKIKGKKYIIHKVDPQETLYSITKRYNVSLDELYEYNPSLKNDGLKMFDIVEIPIHKKNKKQEVVTEQKTSRKFHVVQAGETLFAISKIYNSSVDSLVSINKLENANLSVGDTLYLVPLPLEDKKPTTVSTETNPYHTVQPSETLFGISRLYQVEIEDIQKWNELSDYNLSIGQKLIVSEATALAPKDTTELIVSLPPKDTLQVKATKPALDTLYVETDNSQFKTKTQEVEGIKQTVEEGFAMQIEDTDYTKKFLALHRTAPLGSTIQVKNQMNNQMIEARVVGKLPESAMNQSLLIRLSAAAYKAMGAIDLKTPIIVSYSGDAK